MLHILEKRLQEKISSKKAIIGIVGLGYVGSALAELLLQKGYVVYGFEKSKEKITKINSKKNKKILATDDISLFAKCDIIIVCIQTPIREDKSPNLEYLEIATKEISGHMQEGQLVTIESSINPGVTRDIILPLLKKSKKEFFLSFSPERIDPGNTHFPLDRIPKVVSGADESSLTLIHAFYTIIFQKVVPVSSLETAEMVKIFENTFRFINISLANELKEYTKSLGIDMWEVIQAASTKPFGFLPHYPSPGVGGHCIPVDPFYLYDDAKRRGFDLRFIQLAGSVNDKQPLSVVQHSLLILKLLAKKQPVVDAPNMQSSPLLMAPMDTYYQQEVSQQVQVKGGMSHHQKNTDNEGPYNILLIGVAYKPNIDDIRETPAKKIWELFEQLGHNVSYHDPYVSSFQETQSVPLTEEAIQKHDIAIIVTNHSTIDYQHLASFGKPIIDTRHSFTKHFSNVYYI